MKKVTITGLRVLGCDLALNNAGACLAEFQPNNKIHIKDIKLLASKASKSKKIYNDAKRANDIARFLYEMSEGVDLVISEIPYGSKSYRAAWSLGIVTGIVSSIRKPILFVTPYDVKNVVKKGAEKTDMIAWAIQKYPNLPWTYWHGKPKSENSHTADSIAVVYAGYNKLKTGKYELVGK